MNRLSPQVRLIEVINNASQQKFELLCTLNGQALDSATLALPIEFLWLAYSHQGHHLLKGANSQTADVSVNHVEDGIVIKFPQSMSKRIFTAAPRATTANDIFISWDELTSVFDCIETHLQAGLNLYNAATGEELKAQDATELEALFEDAENEFLDRQLAIEDEGLFEQGGVTSMKNSKVNFDG